MTVPVVFAIAGVAALLISLWGGGVKAKEVEIPSAPLKVRFFVGFVGLVFIGTSIWLTTPTVDTPQQPLFQPTSTAITTVETTTPAAIATDQPTSAAITTVEATTPAAIATDDQTASEAANWTVTFEYRMPIGTWSVGLHQYTLTATCPGEGTNSITNSFTVSDNFAIKDGDVYLRYAGLRLSETYGAEAVEGINPLQPTVAVVTSDQITKTEAEWRAINCSGTVSWDGGTPVPLTAQTPFQH